MRSDAVLGASVGIAHDYLTQFGGAERVVAELAAIWPEAPIYTTIYRPESTFPVFTQHDVRVSRFDRLPVDGGIRALAPIMPAAIGDLELEAHDVVVSSTSGWAHGVRTRPGTFHVAYCHNPARWLYEADGYLGRGVKRMVAAPLCKRLRRWDQAAARRPDLYVVNSAAVQRKVRATYGIDAPVVHPPVDVGRFTPGPRGERLLIVSRLLPYKRVDLAVAAATRLGVGLDVVGEGPELANLQRIAGPTVTFHGRLSDDEVTHLMQTCAGFCLPGAEDFGITPVEANAAGKPVIAYAAGGALETTVEGITGTFIHEQTVEAMEAAMGRVLSDSSFDPWMAVQNAERFSSASFAEQLVAVIERGLERAPSRAPVTTPVPALLAA